MAYKVVWLTWRVCAVCAAQSWGSSREGETVFYYMIVHIYGLDCTLSLEECEVIMHVNEDTDSKLGQLNSHMYVLSGYSLYKPSQATQQNAHPGRVRLCVLVCVHYSRDDIHAPNVHTYRCVEDIFLHQNLRRETKTAQILGRGMPHLASEK